MTENERFKTKGSIGNQLFAVIVVNIAVFGHGCAVGWVSPMLPVLLRDDSPLGDPLTPLQGSLIASSFCIGGIVGTWLTGWLADKIGRKKAALFVSLPLLICWSIKMVFLNPTSLILARLIAGIGGSGAMLISPLYASEIASVDARGVLGSILSFGFTSGILFAYVLGTYLSYSMVLMVMLCIPILFILLMLRMPESPTYLVKTDQLQEATESLAWLRKLSVESSLVKQELDQIVFDVSLSNGGISTREKESFGNVSPWKFLLSSPPSLRALAVTSTLLAASCFMGMFAVISYASSILHDAGSTLAPSTCSIVVGLLQVFGGVLASSFIERLGRKVLLISSCSVVSVSMAILGTYFFLRNSGYNVTYVSWIPVVSLSAAVCCFSMGPGPIPMILSSELFLIEIRGQAISIGLTWMWIATFFVVQFFGPLVSYFGIHVAFWGFAFVGCFVIFITAVFLPETKGKPLDEIVDYFRGKKTRAVPVEENEDEDDSSENEALNLKRKENSERELAAGRIPWNC